MSNGGHYKYSFTKIINSSLSSPSSENCRIFFYLNQGFEFYKSGAILHNLLWETFQDYDENV